MENIFLIKKIQKLLAMGVASQFDQILDDEILLLNSGLSLGREKQIEERKT